MNGYTPGPWEVVGRGITTTEDAEAFWRRLETENPRWWIRVEVHRLQRLLETHVMLALESGTDAARVVALLKEVRIAVLVPKPPKEQT